MSIATEKTGSLRTAFTRLFRQEDGAILVETAFVLPILISMLLGTVEVGRYLIANQKVERAAASIGDLVSQSPDTVTLADMNLLFGIVPHITSPYDLQADGRVMITAVTRGDDDDDQAMVAWQMTGMGTLSVNSQIGSTGQVATLPAGFELPTGETLIISEAWYDYNAIFFEAIDPTGPMYHRAFYRPRLSNLDTMPE